MDYSYLEPEEVFRYFREISSIPHGSGNTEKITDYCIDFAKKHKLKSYHDDIGNVVIYKPATSGCCSDEAVILQGHLDMVCEKDTDCDIDMSKDGLRLKTDGKYVWAEGTTLGGDDGIAVAYMLALLASNDIEHPPIEALFTVDEEIGMLGARALDVSVLKGTRLINIDSEVEGVLTTSCAGGVRGYVHIPLQYECNSEFNMSYSIKLSGLQGGHSGVDIIEFRRNAIIMLAAALNRLDQKFRIGIESFYGGGKDNAIPSSAGCTVCFNKLHEIEFKRIIDEFFCDIKSETGIENLTVSLSLERVSEKHLDEKSVKRVIFYIMQCHNGVYSMNKSIPGMVQTSLNLGAAEIKDKAFNASYLIRSNSEIGKREIVDKLKNFVDFFEGNLTLENDYPAWEYRDISPLRDTMIEAYKEVYGKLPVVTAVHAGLECGILADKFDEIDMVSFGPTLEDIHTSREKMDVASVQRCWVYLKTILKKL